MNAGEGARQFGGRFNPPGYRAVYGAGHLSLAVLEMLVRARKPERLGDLVAARILIDPDLVQKVDPGELAPDWNAQSGMHSSQEWGRKWLETGTLPVLQVPSAVIGIEYNYVINPDHPAAKHIQFTDPEPFSLDPRLFT